MQSIKWILVFCLAFFAHPVPLSFFLFFFVGFSRVAAFSRPKLKVALNLSPSLWGFDSLGNSSRERERVDGSAFNCLTICRLMRRGNPTNHHVRFLLSFTFSLFLPSFAAFLSFFCLLSFFSSLHRPSACGHILISGLVPHNAERREGREREREREAASKRVGNNFLARLMMSLAAV